MTNYQLLKKLEGLRLDSEVFVVVPGKNGDTIHCIKSVAINEVTQSIHITVDEDDEPTTEDNNNLG
jgi:hypothetical protein